MIREFRLSPPGSGRGVSCDANGAFFGDGSSSTGDIHESMNLATLLSIPVVFVIENNGYAYSTPMAEQFAAGTELWRRAAAYGMDAVVLEAGDPGVAAKVLAGVINTSSGRCWSSDTYNPFPGVMENVPAARGYTGGFGTDLMLKDLGLATEAARQAKQPLLLGGVASKAMLAPEHRASGIRRLRGQWHQLAIPGLDAPIPTLPTYHPAYLLRTPAAKRESWHDLIALQQRLTEGQFGS